MILDKIQYHLVSDRKKIMSNRDGLAFGPLILLLCYTLLRFTDVFNVPIYDPVMFQTQVFTFCLDILTLETQQRPADVNKTIYY